MSVENKQTKLSSFSAISLLVSTMMGTGITFMPFAFRYMGYIGSWSMLIYVGFCTFFSLLAISSVVKDKQDDSCTYASLARDVSSYEYTFVNVSMFFNCFLSNVSFYRFLSDIFISTFPIFRSLHDNREMSRKIAAVLFAPILLYLSLKKQLVQLKFSGWISFVSVSFLALLTITYSILIGNRAYKSTFNQFNTGFKYGIPFFFPSMVCESSMIDVCKKLNNKSRLNIVFISLMTAICGILLYGLVGHCGYIVFGECIKNTIIDELADMNSVLNVYVRNNTFDKYNIMSRLSVYSMICVLVCGFPISMVPVTDMFMTYFSKGRSRNSVILILFFTCLFLVFIEKLNIKTIKRVSGAIFSSSVGLVHPFIFHLYSNLKEKKLRKIYFVICTISILIISYIICTILIDIWNNEL